MLVIKVFINERQIDEVWIHNVSGNPRKEVHRYRIEKPEGYEDVEIDHIRSFGYQLLLKKVLEILQPQEDECHEKRKERR